MRIYLVILLFCFLFSCSSNDKSEDYKKVQKIKDIFQLWHEYDSVVLENPSNVLAVHQIRGVVFNNSYIVGIGDALKKQAPMLWLRNGKYIGTIGSYGKGPGEFSGINDAFFESENVIGFFEARRAYVHFYELGSSNIKYLKSIDLAKINHVPHKMYVRGDKRVLIRNSGVKKITPAVTITDMNWNKKLDFHIYSKNSSGSFDQDFVGNDFVSVIESMYSDVMNVYDFNGRLVKKINIKSGIFIPAPVFSDEKKMFYFIRAEDEDCVYDQSWRKIHTFSTSKSLSNPLRLLAVKSKYPYAEDLQFYSFGGDMKQYICYGKVDKKNPSILTLYFISIRVPGVAYDEIEK